MSGDRAVFLDRDGILNKLVPDPLTGLSEGPLSLDDVELVEGAADAVRRLADQGYLLVIVSNQPAAAKGLIELWTLAAIHARVLALLTSSGVAIEASRLCLHHPDAVVPELAGPCACRKPEPGMILDAASELEIDLKESWMIGDTDSDIEAGRRAGCHTLLVLHPDSVHKRAGTGPADLVADSLGEGIAMLLSEGGC